MVSLRLRKRAVPLFWIVKETKGGIGFSEQKPLLEVVRSWLPERCRIMLAGDRFYGTAELVGWCQIQGWKYRLRLKGNLCIYQDQGRDKTLDQLKTGGKRTLEKARFRSGMITHVGILHEPGHDEPWDIAMDSLPNETYSYPFHCAVSLGFSHEKHYQGHAEKKGPKKFSDPISLLLSEAYASFEDGASLINHQELYGFM